MYSHSSSDFSSLVDLLRWRAQSEPDQLAYLFLADGEVEEGRMTYKELDRRARAIGALLQGQRLEGKRALLLYPPGLEYVTAFFGCLYAGVVAVPAYPPRLNRPDLRLASLVANAQMSVALTTTAILSDLESRFTHMPELTALRWLVTTDIVDSLAEEWCAPQVNSDTLAFLQYTSGSTSAPKGVMVSHGNLLYNHRMLQAAFQHPKPSPYVSWLPLFHDMGLIGNMLQALYVGVPCILMPPLAFLQRPYLWLRAISHYQAHTSGGPNFAYDLCVRKITPEERATLDLSPWKLAFNGSEPVRHETLERFTATFEPCGFHPEAFYPCYGLAEATLFVSGGLKAAFPVLATVHKTPFQKNRIVSAPLDIHNTSTLVSCGQTWLDERVVIVDPESLTPCTPDQVGEIWISGLNVAQGYWNQGEATEYTFRAYLADTGEGPFLRTGDMGFLRDGDLFITGRIKDLIIIRGRNLYPQDIERTVEQSHSSLRLGCGAAFSVEIAGEERLIVTQEITRRAQNVNLDQVFQTIRQAVIQEHEAQVYSIVLLREGSIPKTSSGKIQRQACRTNFLAGTLDVTGESTLHPEEDIPLEALWEDREESAGVFSSVETIQAWIASRLAQQLGLGSQVINVGDPFSGYGLDSKGGVSLLSDLGAWLGRRLSPTLLYEYPTTEALARYLARCSTASAQDLGGNVVKTEKLGPIAIIGIGCRFPGAADPEAFWQLLRNGVDAVTPVPTDRWDPLSFYAASPESPGKMNMGWGGFLTEGVDQFDSNFFGISPREAARLDPQQRLLLEVTWEALENAGLAPDRLAGARAGVFVGISSNDYAHFQLDDPALVDAYAGTGNAHSIAANRLSYLLDLHGPSLAVDTACSSSLVAVHLACQSLAQGECDVALVGGVNLMLTPHLTIAFSQAGMMAADGRCKTFDADADGYVRGEGCGVVVLKRLSEALADGDLVLAVVRGSAVNQDGRSNGLTAPNGLAQQAVIRQALENAGVVPADISYVEAHGTGTALGDLVEVEALQTVLKKNRRPDQFCAFGSVKTNIGHLEAAAGIAGLIKTVLSLQHGEIPPHLHLKRLNPLISLERAFFISTERQSWPAGEKHRFAGVSSFGFGGTNAHVILEVPPVPSPASNAVDRPLHLLALSTKDEGALQQLAARFVKYLSRHPQDSVADVCFGANVGRSHFSQRLVVVADSTESLGKQLKAFRDGEKAAGRVLHGDVKRASRPKIAFLFTGQGTQYPGMGRLLYETQPTFHRILDDCAEIVRPYMDLPLLSVLYPEHEEKTGKSAAFAPLRSILYPDQEQELPLHETLYAQPALFAVEYALAELWRSWGIAPDVVMGHSLGEYVAACIAGVFSLEEALGLVAQRARLLQSLPHEGMMAVVCAGESRVIDALGPYREDVSIAAVNGPVNTVVSGSLVAVKALLKALQDEGIAGYPLRASHFSHSPLTGSVLGAFEQAARRITFKAPQIPLISNLTGLALETGRVPDADYWRRHLEGAVQFASGINTLGEQGYELFLEVGPNPTLLGLGKSCLAKKCIWLPSLTPGMDDWQVMLNSLATLYALGMKVDWNGFDRDYDRRPLSLPTYPFQRKRHWIEPLSPQLFRTSARRGYQKATDRQGGTFNEGSQGVMENIVNLTAPGMRISQTPGSRRKDDILARLRLVVGDLLEIDPDDLDVHAPFLEMGADSITLIRAVREIEETFGVEFSIRQLFQELATIDAVAVYIDSCLPVATSGMDAHATKTSAQEKAPLPETETGRIMSQQLEVLAQVMSRQLDVLHNSSWRGEPFDKTPPQHFGRPAPSFPEATRQAHPFVEKAALSGGTKAAGDTEPFVPYKPIEPGSRGGSSPRQQSHLEALIERYTRRTSKSKELTQAYRSVWADNRASAGFRFSIKEMLYPVIGTHSSGSRVWDVDGNEYIDLTMGFGVNLFGHDAPFIKQALKEQIERGIQLGPQSDLAGPVAQLINELTGMERVAFCNSGTEAVMTALRLARTATGRAKVALFAGSYHGLYDGTLARPQATDEDLRSIPMSPGITAGAVEDVLVLDYDSPRSLEILRANVSQLAAVLVEPVQSRRPDLHPKAFLQQLRELTHEVGAALIFDEVITGFRIHPGGAQAWFGIQADLATYGKIVGGGMPIGIVAGRAVYMDGIDGGMWSYEDHSYPSATTTFFAGTFCKHPLAMAAAQAVLTHLKAEGADLQKRLNERTARLAERLNGYFVQNDVPLRVVYFGSLFRFAFTGNMDLLFYHLMEKGIYIWEGRNCFLSTAHTDEDIESVIRAVEESVEEMRAGGFMPESSKGERKPSEKVEAEPALLPMMEAQKQLWVLAQMGEDGSRAYNESLVIDIHGPLRLAAMRAAFHTVIERHDTLRMVIQPDGETQRVLPSLMVDVPLTDFSYLEQAAREEATQWLEGENHQCFDLTQGPLLRVNVLKLEEQRHLLVVTAHHIIVDGWSLGIILQEVGILYSAACQGAVCEMGSPTQFSQYIQEQEQQRQSVQMEAAESFWMERLGDSIPVLELPTSRPRPWVKTYAGARHSVTLGANLVAGLKAVARQKNCTPFMLLLAGYTALLHRLSGQDRIIVGFPVSGRVSKGFENVVGYCTHLAPVQSHVTGDPTFTQHLAHIKETLLEAYEHEYPFALLVKRLNLRDVSRSPILTTTFNLERSLDLPEMFGLEIDLVSPPIRSAKLDLCVNVTEVKGEWRIDLDYNTDLFDASAIERLAGHFCALLENIALDPGQRLSTFPLFAVGEWYKMLVEWNDTAVDYSETCIHDLVGISVERAPDAVAIVCGEQHLTLYKLDERASQLACYLQHVGVGPEIRVGVCVDRSLEMVVGLLAVLQAGGAYVPLDPAYPQARLAFMLNDAQVPVLLTLERLKPHLPVTDALVLCLDADWQRLAAENRVFVPPSVSSENLAYVIYTSGSTGEPKGVQITHAGVGNLIAWHRRVYEITTDDRATQLAGFSFDAAVWELWPYLAAGASVHIVRDEDRASALSLVNWISERRITISFFPTPLAEAALSVEWPADTSLRILLTGGDRLHSGPRQMLPFALINNYGPTENTVVSTWAPVTARDTMSPLIGRPVDNVQVYILDEHLEPVPIGAPGEIYVGGHHLARGYLNRPDLTAASFIPNPFTPPVLLRLAGRVPGGGKEVPRLYRTGDLACYLPDGNIEFLGRADDQVKVRGYRIELGEIEAVLGKHPLVREHVVVARQDASGEKRLIAYFVPQSGQAVTADDLRHFLQMQLPDYMIPSVFVELDSLPLTPNGKLDRQALPDSPALRPELAQAFVAPQSEMERTIARIWQEVLGVDQVGVYDNFFDLGGHSMHIVRAHTKLQEVLGQDFPVVEMFRYPTINGLAKCLMQAPEGLSMDKVRQRVRKQIEGLNRQAGPGRGATR